MKNKIDFVILWVDGNDEKWLAERNKYSNTTGENKVSRYRDWGLLKYWFRGVEKYAPWVNNIYFVTWGHVPTWLNLDNPKLKVVKHSEFIPKKYLPTFNSNVIELNLYRIEGLSDKFVLFNDDVFLFNDVSKNDFFEGDKVKDVYLENALLPTDEVFNQTQYNNVALINNLYQKSNFAMNHKYYNFKYGIRSLVSIFESKHSKFVGFYNQHITQPFFKSSFKKFWDLNYDLCDNTSLSKFRSKTDITQYAVRYMQMLDGCFLPRKLNFGRSYELTNDNDFIYADIKKKKRKVICINDSFDEINFEKVRKELIDLFEIKLNNKSSFEK